MPKKLRSSRTAFDDLSAFTIGDSARRIIQAFDQQSALVRQVFQPPDHFTQLAQIGEQAFVAYSKVYGPGGLLDTLDAAGFRSSVSESARLLMEAFPAARIGAGRDAFAELDRFTQFATWGTRNGAFATAMLDLMASVGGPVDATDDDPVVAPVATEALAARIQAAVDDVSARTRSPLLRAEIILAVLALLLPILLYRLEASDDDRRAAEQSKLLEEKGAGLQHTLQAILDEIREASRPGEALARALNRAPVRARPSGKAKRIAVLRAGQYLKVKQTSGAWLLVEFADEDGLERTGWVFTINVAR